MDEFAQLAPNELLQLYDSGFQGCVYEPEHLQMFLSSIPHPYFDAAAQQFGIVGSGEGKLSLAYKAVQHFDPNSWDERQTTGDCQIGSVSVRMADGTDRQIKDIKIGEKVLSHINKSRNVTDFIQKPYSGKIIKLRTSNNLLYTEHTPDHKFIVMDNNSKLLVRRKIEDINIGDRLLTPFGVDDANISEVTLNAIEITSKYYECYEKIRVKNGRSQCNKYIKLDEKLGWLIGLYAAEGSIDFGEDGKPWRITFNLSSDESIFAKQVQEYIKDIFGADSIITQVPSKPTVLYVRCHNAVVTSIFKHLCHENVYSKNINDIFMSTSKSIRLSVLRGWIDGDGHLSKGKHYVSAVIVSKDLIYFLQKLAISIGLTTTVNKHKPYENEHAMTRQDFYKMSLVQDNAVAIYPEKLILKINLKEKDVCQYGILSKVVEKEEYDYEGDVYCLEVEEDHTFIANGYAQNNCVSHATRNAVDSSRANHILYGGATFGWINRSATEGIYGVRGHGGQGMSCSRAAEYVSKIGGVLLRKNYEGIADLSRYNGSLGAKWGGSGTPAALNSIAKLNQAKTVSLVRTIEEARDSIANGYSIAVCSGYGFSSTRNAEGIAVRAGGWAHAMAWTACDARRETVSKYGGPLFLVQNSWGRWNSGGHPSWGPLPEGSFLITPDNARGMLSGGGSFAFSNVQGFPAQKIPDYGTESFL